VVEVSGPDPASLDPAHALVGRSGELERVSRLIAEASQHGGALMIFGEPGVGKSALLNVAAGIFSAQKGQVLTAAGLEHEAEIAFSALSLLLHPVHAYLAELDGPHHQCLSVVLGLTDGPAPTRLVVANSVLALLRLMANRSPLLLIVDDLQWVDRPSAAILGLVSRRLAGTRAGFLGAARTGEAGFFETSGLPELRVGALSGDASSSLVDAEFPGLAARVRQRVLTESQGNPLALLELPAALSLPERTAEHVLSDALPLGRKLQTAFAARLVHLPDSTRSLLLLAALDGTGDLAVLHRASAAGSGLDVLAPAERANLVQVDDSVGRVSFRHPLVRAAVVAASASAERRHAHRALAHQLTSQPERRAWHLAASCVEPDEAVSALLEDTAASVLRRGDAVGAVAALIRAADLHPSGEQRSRLLAQAAFVGAGVTGDLRSVPKLLADARRAAPGHGESMQAAVAASYALLNADGDLLTAHRLLVSAIENRTGSLIPGLAGADAGEENAVDPALADALHSLLTVCSWSGRADLWPPLLSAIEDLRPGLPRMLHLRVQVQGDPARLDAATLAEFDVAVRELRQQADSAQTVQVAIAAIYIDRVDDCREPLWRVIQDGRAGGAVTSAIRAMMALSVEDFAVGRWDEAQDLAIEGLQLCDAHGYGLSTWFLRLGQALVAAGRGDEDLVGSLTEQMMRWAAPRRVGAVQAFAQHARGLSALGRGDFEDAYQHLSAISPPGTFPAYTAYALRISFDLVEAAVRSGRRDEAVAHLQAMRGANLPSLSGRLALMTAAAAALCAPDNHAAGLFEAALHVPAGDRWPFDLARVHLAYGEHLRRHHTPGAARRHLGTALDAFQSLGARPWVTRTANELRASGRTRQHTDHAPGCALTPQEREIALMAASGMSNKQIGERLFLSHRTVGTHLYRAFPKLGITSRAALRDALVEVSGYDAASAD
jgi:DNA-binding CsgD family transcriptional regulator/energy-coupling factor transporter ATP-binding protein EcfA2